jgi:hypothetical protein
MVLRKTQSMSILFRQRGSAALPTIVSGEASNFSEPRSGEV